MKKFVLAVVWTATLAQCAVCAPGKAKPAPAQDWLVKVNGAPITRSDVQQRLWATYSAEVVETFIDEQLFRQEAAALKIAVPQDKAKALLAEARGRLGADGFKAELRRQGITEAEFRARIDLRLLTEAVVCRKAGLDVTDDEVRQVFEKQKDRLGKPEGAELSRILVKTEQEAKDALARLQAGTPFGKLASEISLDQKTRADGGRLGVLYRDSLVPAVADKIFSLKEGEVSAPIDDVDGFYLVRVDRKLAPEPAQFEQVKDRVRQAILDQKVRQALPGVLAQLRKSAKIEVAGRKAEK